MPYIPNSKQIEAHCAEEQFIGYGGAMGGGKTRWLGEMALQLSTMFPGNFGILARQSGPALKVSTLEVFLTEVLPEGGKDWKTLGAKYHKSDGMLELRHLSPPSKISFTGLDSDNIERIKSLNLGFFGIDEATEAAESIWQMFKTRLRRKVAPKKYRKGMISANPEAGWVKRIFLDQKLKNHRFIQANYMDNPHLPEDYAELFDEMSENWRQRYLFGNWGAVSGLIYKEFDPDFHIIPSGPIPAEWRYFRALDHGQQNPCACLGMAWGYADNVYLKQLIGQDRMDRMSSKFSDYPIIVVYRMYYSPGLVSEHRKNIDELFFDIEKPGLIYADPSIWRKDREKIISNGTRVESSIADEYMETPYALRGLVRGNNSKATGINRLSTLLKIGHIFFMDHPTMKPFIGEGGEIRNYSWKHPRVEDMNWPEEPVDKDNHACDACRYGIMSLPPVRANQAKLIPYNSFMAIRKRMLEDKRRGPVEIDKFGRVRRL